MKPSFWSTWVPLLGATHHSESSMLDENNKQNCNFCNFYWIGAYYIIIHNPDYTVNNIHYLI